MTVNYSNFYTFVGEGLTLYGAYQANYGETLQQKRMGQVVTAIGLSIAAYGLFCIPVIPNQTVQFVADKMPTSETCEAARGQFFDIADKVGGNTKKLIDIMRSSVGIECSNQLPWQSKFHEGGTGYIDGIRPEDMKASVMWGVDNLQRTFVAIKHSCNHGKESAVALFQRYAQSGDTLAIGGRYAADCIPRLNFYYFDDVFENLSTLFKRGTVAMTDMSGTNTLSLVN